MKGVSYNRVMNLDDFSTTFEDRRYINPQVSLDEQNTFIDNYRTSQGQRTEKIAQDTYNLGTAVPSNLGGLSGAGNYFTSRYQTPQTNEVISELRKTAQAQALNDAMSNELAKLKERYNQAYRAAKKRSSKGNPTTTNPSIGGNVGYNPTDIETKDKPNVSDYITDTTFSHMGNLFGYSRKYPLLVDAPMMSTSYQEYTRNIKDPEQKAKTWVQFLESMGYGG